MWRTPTALTPFFNKPSPALCIVDLRAKESRDLLDQIQKEWPDILITALGTLRSEPLRDAEQSGIYAAEDLQLDRRRFQALVERAFDYLKVLQENRVLRETRSTTPSAPEPSRRVEADSLDGPASSPLRLLRFPRAFPPIRKCRCSAYRSRREYCRCRGRYARWHFFQNSPGRPLSAPRRLALSTGDARAGIRRTRRRSCVGSNCTRI